jgi:OmpA-OmpF porin, OOP family
MFRKAQQVLVAIALSSVCSVAVQAQDADFTRLMALDLNTLEGEIQQRYDAGLAASTNESIVAANDARYVWALETKVQCGIALGYLKSETRDETSIGNCQRAFEMMNYRPAPPVRVAPPPPPPLVAPAICNDDPAGIVFFEFDSAEVTSDAGQTLDPIITNIRVCGWRTFSIVGHTDQAGSDAYNVGLSQERAEAVRAAMASRGVAATAMTLSAEGESRPRVVLPDGTRSPQNRRVEISAE